MAWQRVLPWLLLWPRGAGGNGLKLSLLEELPVTCLVPAEEGKSFAPLDEPFMQAYYNQDYLDQAKAAGLAKCVPASDGVEVVRLCEHVPPGRLCPKITTQRGDASSGPPEICVLDLPSSPGASAGIPCPAGLYCPGKAEDAVVCRKGTHCPMGSEEPQRCPLGSFCPVAGVALACESDKDRRFQGVQCGFEEAPERPVVLPEPCPPGFFCKDGLKEECGASNYCPTGAAAPVKCSSSERCPAGSAKPVRTARAGLEVAGFLLLVLLLSASLKCWCLDPQYWWLRLLLGFLCMATLWTAELLRTGGVVKVLMLRTTPLVFFSIIVLGMTWGVFASGRLRKLLGGGQLARFLEPLLFSLLFLAVGGLVQDAAAGVFAACLILAVIVIHDVCVSDLGDASKTGLLALACLAMLGGVLQISRRRAELYAAALPGLIAGRLLFRALWRWQHAQPAPPPAAHGTSSLASSAASWSNAVERRSEERSEASEVELGSLSSRGDGSEGGGRMAKPGVSLDLQHVSLLLPPSDRAILQDISLSIPAGCTVAVMGPSGCGKSSITNVLSGRAGYGRVAGSIVINGESGRQVGIDELRSVTGYVPQDDVMFRNLTVEENVRFQAELRLPRGNVAGIVERGRQVEEETQRTLARLGLGDEALRQTLIGDENVKGVSGGQRKRVSIAMELVSSPWLLFLDEPTSGLDSTTSHSVVDMFTAAAQQSGCTTIAVIHQPRWETLLLFDRLVLLAAGGHLVFSGWTKEVEDYLSGTLQVVFHQKANPADIMLDAITLESAGDMMEAGRMLKSPPEALESRQALGEWLARFWKGREAEELRRMAVPLPPLAVETVNWGEEVFSHMKRAAVQMRREWLGIVGNVVLLVIGLTSYCIAVPQKTPANQLSHPVMALFLLMLIQGASAQRVFGGVGRFVVWREAGCRLSTPLCFLGRDLCALLDIWFSSLVFTAIYFALGPLLCSFYTLFWTAFFFSYCCFGLNYIWSITMPIDLAQMMAVVSAFLSFLFVGLQPAFKELATAGGDVGLNFMALSPMRWAFGFLAYDHTVLRTSIFSNEMVTFLAEDTLTNLAMPLHYIRETGWICGGSCRERWKGDAEKGTPMVSFACGTMQLGLLGLFYRAIALLCMMVTSQLKAKGGGSLFGREAKSDEVDSDRGVLPLLLKDLLVCFSIFVTDFLVSVLLETS